MKPCNIIFCLMLLLMTTGCASKKVSTSSYYPSATTYMNDEGDGSITVRAYGIGRNREDAIEQAAKNAVRDVLFKGVNVPGNALLSKPLVTTVNAEEKYQTFFSSFFSDNGAYKKFAKKKDRRAGSNNKEKNTMQVKVSTTVRIMRPELKTYLIKNGIISQ